METEKLQNFQRQLRSISIADSRLKIGSLVNLSKEYPEFNFREYLEFKTMGKFVFNRWAIVAIGNIAHFEFVLSTFKEDKRLVLDYQLVLLILSVSLINTESCYWMAARDMDIVMDALVAQKFNTEAEQRIGKKLFEELKGEIKLLFEQAIWLEKESVTRLQLKLGRMGAMFAHSDPELDHEELLAYYKCLNTSTDTFFEIRLNIGELNSRCNFTNGSKMIRRNNNNLYSAGLSNAFHLYKKNKIAITYPLMLKPFAYSKTPDFVNYAGLGYIIGHEIGHGFDATGILSNTQLLLSNNSMKLFEEKATCFVEQFGKYVEPQSNMSLDGRKTLNENLSDGYALQAAYRLAFKNRKSNKQGLPGLDYTIRQQFWMMTAANWCGSETTENLRNQIETDPHTVHRFRINGGFQNAVQFARDFKCALGDKMNPGKRCSLA